MKKNILFFLAIIFYAIALPAQTIEGTLTGEVRDSVAGVAGATVFLVKDMKTQNIFAHAVCDADGRFSVTAPQGDYVLGVSSVGYKVHAQPVHIGEGTTSLDAIVLKENLQELQSVVVQGRPVKVRMQADGFTVDTREMRQRANDALDLMRLIPKVQVKGDQLKVIGKENVLVKIGNVLQRVPASEIGSVLKGFDAGLVDQVEVVTTPPLRYDPEGNTAMIVLHTSSVFKEYMGGVIGTEEMWGGKDNYRYGGYGSLYYNHKGLYAMIAPSLNFNGDRQLERQQYETATGSYKVNTPSTGEYDYLGIRGNLQYEYGSKDFIGLELGWNKKKYDNEFPSTELTTSTMAERRVENLNTYDSDEPRFSATAYWESTFGKRDNQAWAEVSYYNLDNDSKTGYDGKLNGSTSPFLSYTEDNDLNTSGLGLKNDYSFHLDDNGKYLLETGLTGSWSFTDNDRSHIETLSESTPLSQENSIRWDELIISPYISSTMKFGQWWLRMGLRYAGTKSKLEQKGKAASTTPDVSKYNNAWLPSLHLSFTPSRRHQLALTVNSSISRPKFADLNPFEWQVNENSFYRGNTELDPERYYATSLTYTFNSALTLKANLKRGLDLITGISSLQDDGRVVTQTENAQSSLAWGFEASYYFAKLSWMSAYVYGHYDRSRYTSGNPDLQAKVLGDEWGVGGYLDFTFNKNRTWTGYISGEYNGRKHTTASTIEPQYDLSVGTSCYLLNRRLAISLSGLNLLPAHYKGVSHRNGYDIHFNNKYNYPTLYVSVSYKFSNGKNKSNRSASGSSDIERRF